MQLAATDDAACLRDALEASVFFASSMGRLGADFTPQLDQLFVTRMHALVVKPWQDGVQQFRDTLKLCAEAGVASPLASHQSPAEQHHEEAPTPLDGPQPPPRSLLALPPMARLVNFILTGLNELRRCLLPGLCSKLRVSLEDILKEVREVLVANERAVRKPGLKGEAAALRETAATMQTVFSEIVEPYLRGSLEAALGNKQGAERSHSIVLENQKVVKEMEDAAEAEQEEDNAAADPLGGEISENATVELPDMSDAPPPEETS